MFNYALYTGGELSLFFIGALLWIVAYAIIVFGIYKYKYVDVPIIFAACNFSWETTCAFFYPANLGDAVDYGYKAWFVLDVFIVIGCFFYGYKQFVNPHLQRNAKALFVVALAMAMPLFFTFIRQYDMSRGEFGDHVGLISAFILNFCFSIEYILTLLRRHSTEGTFAITAPLRLVGTGLIGLFSAVHYPDYHAIIVLAIGCAVADTIYCWLWYKIKNGTMA
jgi:hypothetical protein